MAQSLDYSRSPFIVSLTVTLGLVAFFGCGEDEVFVPAARYEPAVLSFGEVSVADEMILTVEIRSTGTAPLTIVDASVDTSASKFQLTIPEVLMTGLGPGQTSSIAVNYRPCPDAWQNDEIRDGYDFDQCPGSLDSADLVLTDNTTEGTFRIGLSGQPVQPPVAQAFCAISGSCNNDQPDLSECAGGLSFGSVNAGETPCELVVEVRNVFRNDKQVGVLELERVEILVQDENEGPGPLTDGAEAGFELLMESGAPLNVGVTDPFRVPVDPTRMEGAQRFKVRFTGKRTGLWRGDRRRMTGLRMYTNDPSQPIVTAPVTAFGSAPELAIRPSDNIDFGPVEQNTSQTSTLTLQNVGDATLNIIGVQLESANPEFAFPDLTGQQIILNQSLSLPVTYTPTDSGTDQEVLVITTNDPTSPHRVTLRGGAVPRIDVTPIDTVVFELPSPLPPPPAPVRTREITLSNAGFGDLEITRFEILGPGGDPDHPSVNDFSFSSLAACATLPCDPGLTLCPPTNPDCSASSVSLTLAYQNDDISSTDLAELRIRSNDPATPEYTLVLNASDNPCLFPVPQIEISTPPGIDRPCAGAAVILSAAGSQPGGDGTATITDYDWRFIFAPPPLPNFTDPNVVETTFTPARGGVYILGLDVVNSCGASSNTGARETINVADNCN